MAGGHGHGAAFPPVPGRVYTFVGKAMGAVMWFWILHRAKEDGAALLVSQPPTARESNEDFLRY